MNMISFSTAEAIYKKTQETNICLDTIERGKDMKVTAHLDAISMTNEGVISDWPDTIKELWEAIREPHKILKIEKMYRKK